MRGIERVVAALLLAGAVASAVALPRLVAGPDSTAAIAGGAPIRVTTIVEAAPLPAPKPKLTIVRIAVQSIVHTAVVAPSARPQVARHPQPVRRAPHVAPVAPDVVQTPAPVPTPAPAPVPTSSPSVQIATPSTPTVSPTPVLPSLGLGQGKEQGKGHDKNDGAAGTPIVLPQVQPLPPAPAGNGNGMGKGHGHDKGA